MNAIKLSFLMCAMFFTVLSSISAQETESKEALMAQKAEKAAELAKLQGELSAIEGKIASIPGWRLGGVGVVGADFNGNNNWYALTAPNSASNGLGIGFNGFANNIQPKFFWRNLLNVTIQRTATQLDRQGPSSDAVVALSEGLDLSSLYGYRINPKLAVSAEGKFTTSIVRYDADAPTGSKFQSSFFDPAKLTVSAGLTWTPIDALVVLIHPLGYELNFPSANFISAPGAKIGAQYAAKIWKGISWSSNLSAFVPYSGGDATYLDFNEVESSVNYGAGGLFNYTWINGFSAKILNGIGVALNVGLRGDNQIADKAIYSLADSTTGEINIGGLALQSYYTLGLGYTF